MSNPSVGRPPETAINDKDGTKYWEDVSADVDGMLGGIPSIAGYSAISKVDLLSSRSFLAKMGIGSKNGRRKVASALEGGAGIGRVTEGLLLGVADEVDVIEPFAKFTDVLQGKPGMRHIFNVGLEDWQPTEGVQYDLIWTQWCVGHLDDEQLVGYLKRCGEVLSPSGGIIVVKENLSTSGFDYFDETDKSVTREDGKLLSLFGQAGLRIIRTEMQKGLPPKPGRKLLPVKTYALKPKTGTGSLRGQEENSGSAAEKKDVE